MRWMLSWWAVSLMAGAVVFCGVHELGHLLGSRLDDAGRSPGYTSLFGPVVSWAAAVLFTLLFLRIRRRQPAGVMLGAAAVSSALVRLVPAVMFLTGALIGRPLGDDEVAWGLGCPLAALNAKFSADPVVYLYQPAVCFWPMVSFSICAACLVLTYRHLLHLYRGPFTGLTVIGWFAILPAAAVPVVLLLVVR